MEAAVAAKATVKFVCYSRLWRFTALAVVVPAAAFMALLVECRLPSPGAAVRG